MNCHIFDFDGVILDSANIKENVFIDLYKDHKPSSKYSEIVDYLKENPGLPRQNKIKYIEELILKNPESKKDIELKLKLFKKNVFERVIRADFIKGILNYLEFLKNTNNMLFISSASPDDELLEIVKAKNILNYFESIHGSSISKYNCIINIKNKFNFNLNSMYFYGDSPHDFDAAKKAKINFVGIGKYFVANNEIKVLENFENYEKI